MAGVCFHATRGLRIPKSDRGILSPHEDVAGVRRELYVGARTRVISATRPNIMRVLIPNRIVIVRQSLQALARIRVPDTPAPTSQNAQHGSRCAALTLVHPLHTTQ